MSKIFHSAYCAMGKTLTVSFRKSATSLGSPSALRKTRKTGSATTSPCSRGPPDARIHLIFLFLCGICIFTALLGANKKGTLQPFYYLLTYFSVRYQACRIE